MKQVKTVVITGANRGIGLAMVGIYANQGSKVIALCRKSSAKLNALANANVEVVEGIDVATSEGITKMVSAIGEQKISVLINNAGILRDESLNNLNIDTINEQFQVNAVAPLKVCQSLLKNLTQGSKIALITSRMGSISDNGSGGRYGYRMSKAALNAAGMSLAKDLEPEHIAVGIYHPGYVQTDMVNHGGDISADVAAKRITQLIDELTLKASGVFRHSNGEVLPW
ncbi:SDR family oxidoreductase [Pseudoalteromonas denitrificans]|uniref:Short-chain dehydrogenase n=1 Tax=Pseudoalteromonas denitrificans DSM 6059 TaxID=1123010 RepID=A0A1I1T4M1_9GAMM|nr:SDR family oxidoreductase [Pseudoalteromonas denitrificans]SFD53581.1 Short-chain dehydrogenase [Pseudoalteromonas denitrificans DSM 6059]